MSFKFGFIKRAQDSGFTELEAHVIFHKNAGYADFGQGMDDAVGGTYNAVGGGINSARAWMADHVPFAGGLMPKEEELRRQNSYYDNDPMQRRLREATNAAHQAGATPSIAPGPAGKVPGGPNVWQQRDNSAGAAAPKPATPTALPQRIPSQPINFGAGSPLGQVGGAIGQRPAPLAPPPQPQQRPQGAIARGMQGVGQAAGAAPRPQPQMQPTPAPLPQAPRSPIQASAPLPPPPQIQPQAQPYQSMSGGPPPNALQGGRRFGGGFAPTAGGQQPYQSPLGSPGSLVGGPNAFQKGI